MDKMAYDITVFTETMITVTAQSEEAAKNQAKDEVERGFGVISHTEARIVFVGEPEDTE